ncbi:MAG: Mur ligase family protein [Meiothermus sp.]|nr:Mur ligase family protein [Meiothermus sp.]
MSILFPTPHTSGRVISPEWVASLTGGKVHKGALPATDIHWDSRKVGEGTAFIALPGARVHGREFGPSSFEKGAPFVITDGAHPGAIQVQRPEQALLALGRALRDGFIGTVLAVGGSSGKTTTKECIAQGLGWPAPEGNLNNAPGLTRFFWHLNPEVEGAVVELGIDRQLEMAELTYLAKPAIGVMTAIGVEHLDGLGNLDNVIREESWLLWVSPLKLASVQAAKHAPMSGLKTYGLEVGDFQARQVKFTLNDARFTYSDSRKAVYLPYPGIGPVLGATAALATAEMLGKSVSDTIERLANLKLPSGRMQKLELGGIHFINDAYNSNPLSFWSGMEYLKTQPANKWLVLGRMAELGSEAEEHHLEAARLAAEVSPNLVFVGPYAKAQQEIAGGYALETLEQAAAKLREVVKKGDLVYLKASRSVGMEKLLGMLGEEQ